MLEEDRRAGEESQALLKGSFAGRRSSQYYLLKKLIIVYSGASETPGSVMELLPCVQCELGAECKGQDRSPRGRKGEAFLGEDREAADGDGFV